MNSEDDRRAGERVERPSCRLRLLRRDDVVVLLRDILEPESPGPASFRSSRDLSANVEGRNRHAMAALDQFAGQGMDVELRARQEREVNDWNENLDSSPLHQRALRGLVVALAARCG